MSRWCLLCCLLLVIPALGAVASDPVAAFDPVAAAGPVTTADHASISTWPVTLVLDNDQTGHLQRLEQVRSRRSATHAAVVTTTAASAAAGTNPAKAETVLLNESFEGSWPATPWSVSHGAQAPDVQWGRSNHRASKGSHSIWCAGSGEAAPGTGGPVPPGTRSWVIAGPFDLTEANTGQLSFDLWLKTEQFADVFMWLVSTNGESFSGEATSTSTNGWKTITVDLTTWGDEGDVIGAPYVWIALVYQSDQDQLFEGAYVDNLSLVADSGSEAEYGYTYTSDADFERGSLQGLAVEDGSLRLSEGWSTLPFLWVPASLGGTISKVDTETGNELARYRTGPDRELDPSPVAVDLDGSCWVGNRGAGTVVKIGLPEVGGCVDRDNDGIIETATDDNEDGDITGDELLDWGEDECVLYEILLVDGKEQTYTPGDSHAGYLRNNLQALAVDRESNIWAGVFDDSVYYRLDGLTGEVLDSFDVSGKSNQPFAAAFDRAGRLWSASWPRPQVLRLDPTSAEQTVVRLVHGSYGIAIDEADHLFVSGYGDALLSRIDTDSAEVEWTYGVDWRSAGLAVTSDGDLWIAADTTVQRYTVDGILRTTFEVGSYPHALAVDRAGKVWVLGTGNSYLVRLDPDLGIADLEKALVGDGGYDASGDLTGVVARSLTTTTGVWRVVYDSTITDAAWGVVTWTGSEPAGTSTTVKVRSSADKVAWSTWEQAESGSALQETPAGRYLEISVSLQHLAGDELPTLDELTVQPASQALDADFSWSPAHPEAGQQVQLTDSSAGTPTAWAWDFGDQTTSTEQHPTHSFSTAGIHDVSLTVTNAVGSDEVTKSISVSAGTVCGLDCSAAVPTVVEVAGQVVFTATATVTGCTEQASYAWTFGDGSSGAEQSPSHSYGSPGTYSWQVEVTVTGTTCTRQGTITVGGAGACASEYWLPVVSHANGAAGSVWRTDLGLLVPGDEATAVSLSFYGPDGEISRAGELGAQAMVNLTDVVTWISPDAEGSGALRACADQPLLVSSRTYNQLADDDPCLAGGSFGQALDGVEPAAALASNETGMLLQLAENAAFRTNLGLTNTGTVPATVTVSLFDGAGTHLADLTIDLDPGEWHQDNRSFAVHAGRNDLAAGWAKVTVTSGSGIIAYASVINTITNDPTTITLRR